MRFFCIALAAAGVLCTTQAFAQSGTPTPSGDTSALPTATAPQSAYSGPVPLDWTPPALAELSTMAGMKTNFTLDRNMLSAAAAVLPPDEAPVRQSINKLDGVSVHMLRFNDSGVPDERAVNSIREAYHLRGWKHLVTAINSGGPVHNDTTDVWVVMDGINIMGAVVLAETPKSVTLVTVAGTISPVDLLHLRGHFGIPRFEGDSLGRASRK